MPKPPKVALLGRPNVGKSTLFNRLIRSNRAITHDRPGVTRDRMEGVVRSRGEKEFFLIDTGGVTLDSHARLEPGPEASRGFEKEILDQAKEAVTESDLLCLVVDGREGLTPFDRHLADFLRRQGKPLFLVVNKVDGPERQDILLAEFHGLGLPLLPCSAAHGYNVRQLEDEIRERLFPVTESDEELPDMNGVLFAGASRRQKKNLLALSKRDLQEAVADDTDRLGHAGHNEAEETASAPAADAAIAPQKEENSPGPDAQQDTDKSPAPEEHGPLLYLGADGALHAEAAENAAAASYLQEPAGVSGPVRLALLGRPNAGKSSLVNALSGKNRMIVSDIAGTTRDSVDVTVEIDGEPCTFVDTAGVRRRAKITDTVERYSVNSSIKSTTKAHVTLLVLDAEEGLTQQDKRLIDLLNERKTPFMVLVNKSDLIEPKRRKETEKVYREALVFCQHVPLLFVSAKNGHNLKKIVPLARDIRRECGIRISTGQLNRAMASVLERHQPPIVRRVRAKFFYLTQAESLPPTFIFFVNDAERILPSYARYLERSLRRLFAIHHAPMRVNFRSAHKKKSKKK